MTLSLLAYNYLGWSACRLPDYFGLVLPEYYGWPGCRVSDTLVNSPLELGFFDLECFPVSVEDTGTMPFCEWWLVIVDGETISPGE